MPPDRSVASLFDIVLTELRLNLNSMSYQAEKSKQFEKGLQDYWYNVNDRIQRIIRATDEEQQVGRLVFSFAQRRWSFVELRRCCRCETRFDSGRVRESARPAHGCGTASKMPALL